MMQGEGNSERSRMVERDEEEERDGASSLAGRRD